MTLQNAQLQLDDTPDLASETVIKAAHDIAGHLGAGSQVTRKDINAIFQKLTGNSDAADGWSVKMTGCAIELAELLWLREHSGITLDSDFAETDKCFEILEQALPPQHNRHDDQISLQQFSTPARLAWVTALAAGIKPEDIVLEPSAGTGTLAIWPHLVGAKLILNEVDDLRSACLSELFPSAALSAHDGELINELLPSRHNPSLVLMNPHLRVAPNAEKIVAQPCGTCVPHGGVWQLAAGLWRSCLKALALPNLPKTNLDPVRFAWMPASHDLLHAGEPASPCVSLSSTRSLPSNAQSQSTSLILRVCTESAVLCPLAPPPNQ